MLKVQYGSDYVVILAIVAGATSAFLGFSKALDFLASAGVRNEERLGKKDERLRRNGVIHSAEEQAITEARRLQAEKAKRPSSPEREAQLERMLPMKLRDGIASAVRRSDIEDPRVVAAIAVLAEYGVTIQVREE